MSRWVSSVVGETVLDFTTDLADGLILYKLVNCIAVEAGGCHHLKPLYAKPTFKVQKVENVEDVLQYCRLVLKISMCGVSADNVVDGNLKLILGLIWTLFVVSTSCSISVQNETRSFSEIRAILLQWINGLGHRKALREIRNFDKDWSLQTDARPDLVFACILDFYIPNLVSYSEYSRGKKLANLVEVIDVAQSELGIPKLAEADDFNVLVPDEKCVILYVLQWYMFFEVLDVAGLETGEVETYSQVLPEKPASNHMARFVASLLECNRIRNKYDTRALRLTNQINNNLAKLKTHLDHIEEYITPAGMSKLLDQYCANIDPAQLLLLQVASRSGWPVLNACVSSLVDLLQKYQHFRLVLKPEYAYQDFPELQALYKSLNAELKELGVYCGYIPLKLLSLESIGSRLQMLLERDTEVAAKLTAEISALLESRLGSLDSLVESLKLSLETETKQHTPDVAQYIDNLDTLQGFKADICRAFDLIKGAHTTSDLRAILGTMDSVETVQTPPTPEDADFARFKATVQCQKNRTNLTFSDVRSFLKRNMPSEAFGATRVNDFVQLIPTRRLLNRSDSDNFSVSYASDDSDDTPIFDQVLKTLEHKLLGNHNKLYDLEGLVSRIDDGFRV